MKLQHTRPEDRQRKQGADSPAWVDTLPTCFRSEGFAEDLHELQAGPQAPADEGRRLRDGVFPLLGLALAGATGLMGVFAR